MEFKDLIAATKFFHDRYEEGNYGMSISFHFEVVNNEEMIRVDCRYKYKNENDYKLGKDWFPAKWLSNPQYYYDVLLKKEHVEYELKEAKERVANIPIWIQENKDTVTREILQKKMEKRIEYELESVKKDIANLTVSKFQLEQEIPQLEIELDRLTKQLKKEDK